MTPIVASRHEGGAGFTREDLAGVGAFQSKVAAHTNLPLTREVWSMRSAHVRALCVPSLPLTLLCSLATGESGNERTHAGTEQRSRRPRLPALAVRPSRPLSLGACCAHQRVPAREAPPASQRFGRVNPQLSTGWSQSSVG